MAVRATGAGRSEGFAPVDVPALLLLLAFSNVAVPLISHVIGQGPPAVV
jgi:hypothetical protein